MKLTHKSKNDSKLSPFDKEPESPRKRLSPKTLATIKGGTKEYPIKMDQDQIMKSVRKATESGVESRMRTDSMDLTQENPGSISRSDLKNMTANLLSKDGPSISLIEREFSQDDILASDNSKHTRQVVGLVKGTLGSEPNSSMQIVASRDDLERTGLTAKDS